MSIRSKKTQATLKVLEQLSGTVLTLGSLLHSIRLGEDMTQVEFAKLLGISKQQLCDIEHERKLVSPRLAVTYAEKLGYSKAQFIRLSLQDIVDRDELGVEVDVHIKGKKRKAI